MKSINWYWNRLTRMSPAEISHRTRKSLFSQTQQLGIGTAYKVPLPTWRTDTPRLWLVADRVNLQRHMDAAQQVIMGDMPLFAIPSAGLGRVPHWNQDPSTGIEAPLVFGKLLNYRDERLVGDIKYLWEVNRHLQFVTLAQAFVLSQDTKYLNALRVQLSSWLEQCPYLKGPNWTSTLELSIRLINWSITWDLIGGQASALFAGEEGKALRWRWLISIYQHAHFIRGYFSSYSSANNHLIGEAAGLFVACITWPLWREFKKWQDRAFNILNEEALRQNAPDGVNREQATSYQQFVLDFLIIAGLVGQRAGIEFPTPYWARIEAMLEYLASIMNAAGHVPMIGDADDGYVVRLSQEPDFCPYRSLLATGTVLFKRGDFKAKAGPLDDKTRWLLGEQAQVFSEVKVDTARLPARRAFPEGGYYILGGDFETVHEIRLIADAGPLGYLSIAAHGHADALAFTLSLGGHEFLIDPGTYAYHTHPVWRNYFRGTAAHNTVRIDGQNQSVIGGNFMWLHHADAHNEQWCMGNDLDLLEASHDGYRRLKDPVVHRRRIAVDKKMRYITVTDFIECRKEHTAEWFWHFSEQCQVVQEGQYLIAKNSSYQLIILPPEGNMLKTIYWGDETLPVGWVSRRFGVKVPTTTLVWKTTISGTKTFVTRFEYLRTAAYEN